MTLRPVVDKPSIYLLEKYSNRIQAEWYNVAGAAYYKVAYYKKGDSDCRRERKMERLDSKQDYLYLISLKTKPSGFCRLAFLFSNFEFNL